MVRLCFYTRGGRINKLCSCGHSGYAEKGGDIVCAAVSANVQLVEAAINDGIGANAAVRVSKSKPRVSLTLPDGLNEAKGRSCEAVLRAFYRVMREQEKEYGNFLKVKITEE